MTRTADDVGAQACCARPRARPTYAEGNPVASRPLSPPRCARKGGRGLDDRRASYPILPVTKPATATDARQSLVAHVAAKGAEIREKHGPVIGWAELQHIVADRACVRYPCEIVFDAAPLEPGETAHPVPKGARPEDGFILYVHPFFQAQLSQVPPLALYQLVVVNYGEFASPDDAETFGASVLGLSQDEYYHTICELADSLTAWSVARRTQIG